MHAVNAQFLFDFGSPNAYLAHRVLPGIAARTGVVFDQVPILLGGLFKLTNNRSPMVAYADVANKQAYEKLEFHRFIARHGLREFRFNAHFPVNTLLVMRGAVAAQQLGCFTPYIDAVFRGMWEHNLDMADPQVVGAALKIAGLDADTLLAATRDEAVKARLMANTQHASDRGAFGAPTFFIGKDIFFGKDRLGEVEDEIRRQLAT